MPLTAVAMRAMMRQLSEVEAQPVDGVRLQRSDDLNEVRFELDGPEGTPFAAGRFAVALLFDERYPAVPPRGVFRTRIFHPNISPRGEVCVNALKRDWHSGLGLRHILLVIRCLLVEPNAESALNEEAGRLLLEDYDAYARKAAMMTNVYARRPDGVARFATCAAAHDKSRQHDDVNDANARHRGGDGGASDATCDAFVVAGARADAAAVGDHSRSTDSCCNNSNNSDNNNNNNNAYRDESAVWRRDAVKAPKKAAVATTGGEKRRSNALRRI